MISSCRKSILLFLIMRVNWNVLLEGYTYEYDLLYL